MCMRSKKFTQIYDMCIYTLCQNVLCDDYDGIALRSAFGMSDRICFMCHSQGRMKKQLNCFQCTEEDHQWIICDGPVDAVWIENMNTVLDDNKMLCLANSERIKLTPYVHMVFEVQNL